MHQFQHHSATNDFLEKYYKIFESEKTTNDEIAAIMLEFVRILKSYAAPQYDKDFLEGLILVIINKFNKACTQKGFERGMRHAFKLMISNFAGSLSKIILQKTE